MMKKLVLIKNNNKISRKIVLGIQFEEIVQNIIMVSKIFIFKEFLVNNIWWLRYTGNSVQENSNCPLDFFQNSKLKFS